MGHGVIWRIVMSTSDAFHNNASADRVRHPLETSYYFHRTPEVCPPQKIEGDNGARPRQIRVEEATRQSIGP